ncbi:MAG: cytochrome C [Desulfuromonadales bacterium]|nr:cytochrome C [Desulfuromonadales bacterium]
MIMTFMEVILTRYVPLSLFIALILALGAFVLPAQISAESLLQGAHAVTSSMPKSCRACHRGMRMAIAGEEKVCFSCHGDAAERSMMQSRGYLVGSVELADIKTVLNKPYNHPVLAVANVHRQNETLPEDQLKAPRHAECVDCHNPHVVSKENPFAGIPGRRVVNAIVDIEFEYELCYKCHADSANLPGDSTNKHAEFKVTNPSYHPVEGEGAKAYVISLKDPYKARAERPGDVSILTCGSCHGNDDHNGPKGPHGSNYEGLLTENYVTADGYSESAFVYALCYKCHERSSILGNESFPEHARHIIGQTSPGGGTSCYSCHDAHGSSKYTSLIRFNEDVVEPSRDGRLEYKQTVGVALSGSCTLICHGVEHVERSY